MSRQHQAVEAQEEKRKRSTTPRNLVNEQIGGQVDLPELPGGPVASPGDASIQVQASRLNDPRFQAMQRQAMAGQLGRMAGNRYLQRVMEQIREDEPETDCTRSPCQPSAKSTSQPQSQPQQAARKALVPPNPGLIQTNNGNGGSTPSPNATYRAEPASKTYVSESQSRGWFGTTTTTFT